MKRLKITGQSDVFISEYPYHKELKDDVVPLLAKYPDCQGRKTNVKATMTEYQWDPPIERLKRFKSTVVADINSYYFAGRMRTPELRDWVRITDFWWNFFREGDHTAPHNHFLKDFYSFVYFLKTESYHPPLVFTHSKRKIRPKEGTYVIFPSHLMHHVPPNKSKEMRMTLSGNVNQAPWIEEWMRGLEEGWVNGIGGDG